MSPDFLQLAELFTEEEKLAQETARNFVKKEVLPIITSSYQKGEFPLHLVKKMGDLGFLGANLHWEGLPGASDIAYGLILQELERGDSAIRSFASVQGALVMYPILSFGSEEQKKKWLPKLASGEAIGCFGLTEPNAGSDPSSLATQAVRTAKGFDITGNKIWITNGSIADLSVIWAKLDGKIQGFLVESSTPGFLAQEIQGKLSFRASVTAELRLDHCLVPESSLLPKAQGLKAALSCLTQARYGIAWGVLGAASACYETALGYVQERAQFGRPIASFQLVQEKLVTMLSELTKAQLLAFRLGELKKEGKLTPVQVSLAKRNNVEIALKIARTARSLLGAYGISEEFPIFRHMANLETVSTYEGTHEIHTLILGEAITGFSAFS